MTSDSTSPAPLIREGSRVFAAIAAAVLLVGGMAGMAGGTDTAHPHAAAHSDMAATAEHDAEGEHGHGEVAAATGAAADDAHGGAAHPHEPAAGEAVETAAAAEGGHAHGAPAGSAAPAGPAHDDHAPGVGDAHAPGDAHSPGDAHPPGETHAPGDDHADHDPAMGDGEHHHATGCADDHPASKALVADVQGELATTYKDIAALVALGYHPYFDSLVPGGYPPGGEGISHWINPNYIDDGVVLDPQQPETILLDDWNWPIGMMFINDPGVPPKPVYVADDGKACSPWHPHTDAPARFGWYYYRAMYDREMEGEVPAQTPEMMHVWAIPNAKGVYAAHDYPKREERKGAPGPMPSYFSDAEIPPEA